MSQSLFNGDETDERPPGGSGQQFCYCLSSRVDSRLYFEKKQNSIIFLKMAMTISCSAQCMLGKEKACKISNCSVTHGR